MTAYVEAIKSVKRRQKRHGAKLREMIHQTTNKVEQFNAFSKWLSFVEAGRIKALTPEESEKQVKFNDLLANAVILNNTLEMSGVVRELMQEGYHITKEYLAALSPYQTQHIKRFGDYVIDLETLPAPIGGHNIFSCQNPR